MLRGQTDDLALITALLGVAQLELTVGRYAESAQIMQEVLALSRQHAFPVMEAKALNFLGYIAGSEGRHAEGRRLLEQSLAIAQRSGNLRSQASTLNSLGYVLMLSCDYPAARRCLEESLSLKQIYSTPSSDAGTMLNLAYLELRSGAYAKAEGLFQRILRQMLGSQTIPVALDALAGIALIMARRGQPERAFELASVVLRHPSIWNETAVTANQLLASLRAQAVLPEPPDQLPDWRDPALGWQELVNSVLAELEAQEAPPLEPEPA
jgi:tetratricopeptide (TPR) repeat protein